MEISEEKASQASLEVQRSIAEHTHKHRWWILAVVAIAQLMVVLDATVVNIALPSAQKALAFSNADRQWIVTGYALSFGSLLLLGGRIADLFGRKITFIVGLFGFAIASAVGGASTGFPMLVTARAVQGAFGALLAPAALSLLTTTFTSSEERGKAFGIYGAIAGAGGAIGLLLGGFLTEYLSWRWSLYVNLIFAVAAAIGGIVFLTKDHHEEKPKLDIPGVALASAAMFSIVYGFSHAETTSWSNSITVGFLVAAAVLLVAFIFTETKVDHPLLPMRVVLDRNRGGAYLSVFIASVGMFGVFLFLTYYLQETLGYSPVKTGLAFIPMIALLVVVATASTAKLLPKFGPKYLVALGMFVAAGGMLMLSRVSISSSYTGVVLPALLILGAGLGGVMAPSMNTATAGVSAADAGVASATVNTSQQIGGSIGTALLNTLAASAGTAFLAGKVLSRQVLAEAAVHSYITAFRWSALVFAIGGVLAALLLKPGAPKLDNSQPMVMH
ncbi:drug resistance transporter, EmrB/QacA subfamily [Ferrithrix thermotolerans DSM 19514]|uniref:Drug resistance transporter, EmrB/QacA subfamily n=1 Tax=Ferrithrix thermotolerans DSM 19514 TaxID=1121881 RepID=A0A1M4X7G1_9ACTN|nr:MFS transporter [Ferrithrix thermotolerans]SHE89052.1 drug resistance transporter, EmrB/QacA subfamily [Ferrithrix thermotolerans DSM 19514]